MPTRWGRRWWAEPKDLISSRYRLSCVVDILDITNDRHFFCYQFNPVFIASISKEALFGIPIPGMHVKCGAVYGAVAFIADRMR